MRGAPLRVQRHENQLHMGDGDAGPGAGVAKYADAVTKLIPGEVVAAYLTGKTMLQAGTLGLNWWLGWTIFCLLVVIGLRRWMTSDDANGVPTEWSAVVTAALSFIVWVYSFGDVFQLLGWWSKEGSALVLIGWTLASPLALFLLKKVLPS